MLVWLTVKRMRAIKFVDRRSSGFYKSHFLPGYWSILAGKPKPKGHPWGWPFDRKLMLQLLLRRRRGSRLRRRGCSRWAGLASSPEPGIFAGLAAPVVHRRSSPARERQTARCKHPQRLGDIERLGRHTTGPCGQGDEYPAAGRSHYLACTSSSRAPASAGCGWATSFCCC